MINSFILIIFILISVELVAKEISSEVKIKNYTEIQGVLGKCASTFDHKGLKDRRNLINQINFGLYETACKETLFKGTLVDLSSILNISMDNKAMLNKTGIPHEKWTVFLSCGSVIAAPYLFNNDFRITRLVTR